MVQKDSVHSLIQELRRGTIILSVLSQLTRPQYGYSLVSSLEEKGFAIDPGTLYPLMRRLEKQGILESSWDTNEARPRKYYMLSPDGRDIYRQLCLEWKDLSDCVNRLIQDGEEPSEGGKQMGEDRNGVD